MAYSFRRSSVRVAVDSEIAPAGRLTVRGTVAYSPALPAAARRRAEAAALLAMIAGLTREAERGLARGARRATLRIDGDPALGRTMRGLTSRNVAPPGSPSAMLGRLGARPRGGESCDTGSALDSDCSRPRPPFSRSRD